MSKFTEFLALIGVAPKTLPAAAAAMAEAKGQLDSVNSLFTAAGLNLETMLTAGSDALKAHMAGLSAADGALATAQAKISELTAAASTIATAHASALAAKSAELMEAMGLLSSAHVVVSAIGLDPIAVITPEATKTAFAAHVKKAANLELAKTGHPPIRDLPGANDGGTKAMTRAAFNALSPFDKMAFSKAGGILTQ